MRFNIGDKVELNKSGLTLAQGRKGLEFAGSVLSPHEQGTFEVVGINGSDYTLRSLVTQRTGTLPPDLLMPSRILDI